ncbi:T9SS type A sorting domain-containing protein, partial [bacterium]|nr:T9SS type A sorting domain-containing protein [bacterium]
DCNYTPTFNNSPAIGFLINCFNDTLSIEVYISNFGIIDPDSLSIKWEESFYTHSSELLEIRDTSFVFRVPPGIYHDGDTLSICIDKLVDTEGYWRYDSICWDYYIDIDEYPPELSGFVPPIGETVEMLDTISLIATDPSGINTTTVQFHFADSLFTLNDSCVRFLGDTIYFNLRCAGFDPCLGDTCVEICLSLQDDNKDCTPTAVETCWVVYSEVDDTPPFLSGFYPEINDTILILDIIHLIAVDSSGIDFSSIEFSFMDSIIMWGDSCIWLIGDTIYFDPICAGLNPGWVDTTLTVCVYLQDNVVECSPNAIDTCWSFYLNSSGIDEVQLPTDFEIKAYPNPFNSRCYLSGPDGLKADIFDVSGRFIKSIKLPGFWCGENEKGEKVGSGIYFLRVEGCKPGISRVLLLK